MVFRLQTLLNRAVVAYLHHGHDYVFELVAPAVRKLLLEGAKVPFPRAIDVSGS